MARSLFRRFAIVYVRFETVAIIDRECSSPGDRSVRQIIPGQTVAIFETLNFIGRLVLDIYSPE